MSIRDTDEVPSLKWCRMHASFSKSDGIEKTLSCPILLSAITARGTLNSMLQEAMKAQNYIQAFVTVDDMIAAVEMYGQFLWLDKVPPPKYWLNYKKRPMPTTLAECGLPIPARYRESDNAIAAD